MFIIVILLSSFYYTEAWGTEGMRASWGHPAALRGDVAGATPLLCLDFTAQSKHTAHFMKLFFFLNH